jgi:hypothetical protein
VLPNKPMLLTANRHGPASTPRPPSASAISLPLVVAAGWRILEKPIAAADWPDVSPTRSLNAAWYGSTVLFFDDELPLDPTEGERALTARLGPAALSAIDATLRRQAVRSWRKVARILVDALEAGAFSRSEDCYVHLHLRRLIALVESGELESQGDLRTPRRSEVRLPEGAPRSAPRNSTHFASLNCALPLTQVISIR